MAFGGCKSQIFVFGNLFAGRENELGSLADVCMRLRDGFDWLEVGLETILRIMRLRRSVCGAHGCSAPPPSLN